MTDPDYYDLLDITPVPHDKKCWSRLPDPDTPCNCGAFVLNLVGSQMRDMRAAMVRRNDLARQCADLEDQLVDARAQIVLLRRVADAARWVVDDDAEGRPLDVDLIHLGAAVDTWDRWPTID